MKKIVSIVLFCALVILLGCSGKSNLRLKNIEKIEIYDRFNEKLLATIDKTEHQSFLDDLNKLSYKQGPDGVKTVGERYIEITYHDVTYTIDYVRTTKSTKQHDKTYNYVYNFDDFSELMDKYIDKSNR